MKTLLMAAIAATILAGCSARPVVPDYSGFYGSQPRSYTGSADFIGFSFWGMFVNGQPHGEGYCRAQGSSATERCEFRNGIRVDASWLARRRKEQEAVIAVLGKEAKQRAFQEEVDRQAARARREERESNAALWGQAMNNFSSQVNAGAQQGYAEGAAARARLEQARLAAEAELRRQQAEQLRQAYQAQPQSGGYRQSSEAPSFRQQAASTTATAAGGQGNENTGMNDQRGASTQAAPAQQSYDGATRPKEPCELKEKSGAFRTSAWDSQIEAEDELANSKSVRNICKGAYRVTASSCEEIDVGLGGALAIGRPKDYQPKMRWECRGTFTCQVEVCRFNGSSSTTAK